jgi:tetratricopeptide (TPR) repeat protein
MLPKKADSSPLLRTGEQAFASGAGGSPEPLSPSGAGEKPAKNRSVLLALSIATLLILLSGSAIVFASFNRKGSIGDKMELGVRYLLEGDYEEAILAYTAAIEIDPRSVEAYMGRADAYVKLEKYDEAIADYEQALEIDELNEEAYIKLAVCYKATDGFQKAIDVLLGGLDATGNSQVRNELELLGLEYGKQLLEIQKYEDAQEIFTLIIEVNIKNVAALNGRGDAFAGLGRHDDAARDYERSLELDKTQVEIYIKLADCYITLGNTEKGIEILKKGLEETSSQAIKDKLEQLASDDYAIFSQIPSSFVFSSGAGGWGNELEVNDDGSFEGHYFDANIGDVGEGYPRGSLIECYYSGEFTNIKKVNDYEYSMNVLNLQLAEEPGKTSIVDGRRIVAADPYGFDNAYEFRLYLPGRKTADMPEGFLEWPRSFYSWREIPSELPIYGLYNIGGEQGFVAENDQGGTGTETPAPAFSPPPTATPAPAHAYEVVKGDATWYQAYGDAVLKGGYLCEINSAEEFDAVAALAFENGIRVLWLGARREDSKSWDQTNWTGTNDPMTYTKWYTGEPSYIGEDDELENCLMAFNVGGEWFFNDSANDVSKFYAGKIGWVIEKDGRAPVTIEAEPVNAPSTLPLGRDGVKILSLTPSAIKAYGSPTEITATIEFRLVSVDQGIVYLGFNTAEPDRYHLEDYVIVKKGRGTAVLKAVATPVGWGTPNSPYGAAIGGVEASQGLFFGAYANLSEYPHPDSWNPLDAAVAVLGS